MATNKKKPTKTMAELTRDFEDFIKGKEQNPNSKKDFDKLLKKVVKQPSKKQAD